LSVNPDKIFTTNKIGFYCSGDLIKMISNLEMIFNDVKLYNQLSLNIKKYLFENHNQDKIVNELAVEISKILN
jgi:hypothetical protein